MISVIVPTMWRVPSFLDELKKLSEYHLVGEIILIDNTECGISFEEPIDKLVHIKEFRNTYVNPAWNKGVTLSQYDKLLIMNDDVITNYHIIHLVYDMINENYGMIGAGKSCWNPHWKIGTKPGLGFIHHRPHSYASFFFIHKSSYKMIPEEMKILFGDEWLFHNVGKPNLEIQNWFIGGDASQTSDDIQFNTIKQQDRNYYEQYCNVLKHA